MSVRGPVVLLVALATLLLVRAPSAQTPPGFGEPPPGLPASLLSAFEEGRQRFKIRRPRPPDSAPSSTRGAARRVTPCPFQAGSAAREDAFTVRFGLQAPGQPFNPLFNVGGPSLQRQSVTADLDGCPLAGEIVPREANAVGLRQPPGLFGLGLIQAIPESTIARRADPDDIDGDGIIGRPNVSNGIIGRFGWKAAVATVADFVGLSLIGELGITNFLYPHEPSAQGAPIPAACKIAGDPQDFDASRLAGITAFLSFRRAAAGPHHGRGPPRRDALRAGGLRQLPHAGHEDGAQHHRRPERGRRAALLRPPDSRHGKRADDRITRARRGRRWRTPPLWGLRVRQVYLHDGRTPDLTAAIALHGGEAGRAGPASPPSASPRRRTCWPSCARS